MGEIYTDLNSDFPLKVSTMNRVQDVTLSAKPYVDLYNQYYSQGDLYNANKVINDHPELLTMMLDMTLVNQIIDEIKATQRTFKDDVESYILTVVKIKGEYSGSVKYTKYNMVYHNGQPYMNIADDTPIGTTPTNSNYWYALAIKGEQGESGLGLTPRGSWSEYVQYYKDDLVSYNNALWAAKEDNIGYFPNDTSKVWYSVLSMNIIWSSLKIQNSEIDAILDGSAGLKDDDTGTTEDTNESISKDEIDNVLGN